MAEGNAYHEFPQLEIVFPKYTQSQCVSLIASFLSDNGFVFTREVLECEAKYRQCALASSGGLSKAELEQHVAFCLSNLGNGPSTLKVRTVPTTSADRSPPEVEGHDEGAMSVLDLINEGQDIEDMHMEDMHTYSEDPHLSRPAALWERSPVAQRGRSRSKSRSRSPALHDDEQRDEHRVGTACSPQGRREPAVHGSAEAASGRSGDNKDDQGQVMGDGHDDGGAAACTAAKHAEAGHPQLQAERQASDVEQLVYEGEEEEEGDDGGRAGQLHDDGQEEGLIVGGGSASPSKLDDASPREHGERQREGQLDEERDGHGRWRRSRSSSPSDDDSRRRPGSPGERDISRRSPPASPSGNARPADAAGAGLAPESGGARSKAAGAPLYLLSARERPESARLRTRPEPDRSTASRGGRQELHHAPAAQPNHSSQQGRDYPKAERLYHERDKHRYLSMLAAADPAQHHVPPLPAPPAAGSYDRLPPASKDMRPSVAAHYHDRERPEVNVQPASHDREQPAHRDVRARLGPANHDRERPGHRDGRHASAARSPDRGQPGHRTGQSDRGQPGHRGSRSPFAAADEDREKTKPAPRDVASADYDRQLPRNVDRQPATGGGSPRRGRPTSRDVHSPSPFPDRDGERAGQRHGRSDLIDTKHDNRGFRSRERRPQSAAQDAGRDSREQSGGRDLWPAPAPADHDRRQTKLRDDRHASGGRDLRPAADREREQSRPRDVQPQLAAHKDDKDRSGGRDMWPRSSSSSADRDRHRSRDARSSPSARSPDRERRRERDAHPSNGSTPDQDRRRHRDGRLSSNGPSSDSRHKYVQDPSSNLPAGDRERPRVQGTGSQQRDPQGTGSTSRLPGYDRDRRVRSADRGRGSDHMDRDRDSDRGGRLEPARGGRDAHGPSGSPRHAVAPARPSQAGSAGQKRGREDEDF